MTPRHDLHGTGIFTDQLGWLTWGQCLHIFQSQRGRAWDCLACQRRLHHLNTMEPIRLSLGRWKIKDTVSLWRSMGLVDLHSPLFNQPPLHSPQCRSRCQSHGVSGIGHVMGDRFPMTRSEKQATKEGRPPCPPHVQSSCENLRCPDSGGSSTGMDDPSPHFLGRPAVTWCENRKPMLLHAER